MKREGQLWIPDKPITKKPAEVRMGKGKGNPEGFVAPVTPGRILTEAEGDAPGGGSGGAAPGSPEAAHHHQVYRKT